LVGSTADDGDAGFVVAAADGRTGNGRRTVVVAAAADGRTGNDD
jgi:hypothetical protein